MHIVRDQAWEHLIIFVVGSQPKYNMYTHNSLLHPVAADETRRRPILLTAVSVGFNEDGQLSSRHIRTLNPVSNILVQI